MSEDMETEEIGGDDLFTGVANRRETEEEGILLMGKKEEREAEEVRVAVAMAAAVLM